MTAGTPSPQQRHYQANNLVGELLSRAKQRAAKNGRKFELTPEDIRIPERCPICSVVLVSAPGRAIASSPTLDRTNNALGYEQGNVAVICYQCNRVKADASAELHERIAAYMREREVLS